MSPFEGKCLVWAWTSQLTPISLKGKLLGSHMVGLKISIRVARIPTLRLGIPLVVYCATNRNITLPSPILVSGALPRSSHGT